MMGRIVLTVAAIGLSACQPSYPLPVGITLTGDGAEHLTPEDRASIPVRIGRVTDCFRANGFPIKGRVKEVRVHDTTCERPKFRFGTRYVYGGSDEKAKIILDQTLIEVEHEAAAVFNLDHGPEDHSDLTHPSMVCGEPLKREWFAEHPRRPCIPEAGKP